MESWDNQISNPGNKGKNFSKEFSCISFGFSIETLMVGLKIVKTEKKLCLNVGMNHTF